MIKLLKQIQIFSIIMIVALFSITEVYATSWIKLKPEEVNKQATIIVLGKYNFDDSIEKREDYEGIFSPVKFKVEKYYRGSGADIITSGVDMFDMGWVKEVQDNGASFLLFVEKSKNNDKFLTPIAGPNGMIQIVNSMAKTGNKDEELYFNNLLDMKANSPIYIVTDGSKYKYIIADVLILCVIIGICLLGYRTWSKKKKKKYRNFK